MSDEQTWRIVRTAPDSRWYEIVDEGGAIIAEGVELEDAARILDGQAALAEVERLRAALGGIMPYVENYEDEGPRGEGWQSPKLEAASQAAREALAAPLGARPPLDSHPVTVEVSEVRHGEPQLYPDDVAPAAREGES